MGGPCPIRPHEISSRKSSLHRKSRMDTRTRERLPVLPALVSAVARHRTDTAALLTAARQAAAGEEFTAAGQTLVRLPVRGGSPLKVWARDPATGERTDLTGEEDCAFWAWAAIEVLRHTGIRIEELLELSHHSLVQYKLPGSDLAAANWAMGRTAPAVAAPRTCAHRAQRIHRVDQNDCSSRPRR